MELNMNQNNAIRLRLHSLSVFRQLLADPVVQKLDALLGASTDSEIVDAWGDFAAALYPHSVSLTDYLLTLVL